MSIQQNTARFFLSLLATLGLAACTLIPATPGADKIMLGEPGKVAACESKGATTVGVLHQVAGINRLPEVVAEELERLARNNAVDMGGDTIVPEGEVAEGKRKFSIYKCQGSAPAPAKN